MQADHRATSSSSLISVADYERAAQTVDLPILGVRERDLRSAVHVSTEKMITSARAAGASGVMTPADLAALIDPDQTWMDIERFAAESPSPVLVKGILTPRDAHLAVEHGAVLDRSFVGAAYWNSGRA
jgi:4-hydroxymandelate oxidase